MLFNVITSWHLGLIPDILQTQIPQLCNLFNCIFNDRDYDDDGSVCRLHPSNDWLRLIETFFLGYRCFFNKFYWSRLFILRFIWCKNNKNQFDFFASLFILHRCAILLLVRSHHSPRVLILENFIRWRRRSWLWQLGFNTGLLGCDNKECQRIALFVLSCNRWSFWVFSNYYSYSELKIMQWIWMFFYWNVLLVSCYPLMCLFNI